MGIYSSKINNKRTSLNEVYFGDSSLQELQQCITNIRKDIGTGKWQFKINTHPELYKFNRLAEDKFGFKTFSLNVINNIGVSNAFTLPLTYNLDIIDLSKHVRVDENGYRFDRHSGFVLLAYITRDMLLRKDITDREVMAFILHEIGHNFSSGINKRNAMFTDVIRYLTVYDVALYTMQYRPIKAMKTVVSKLNLVRDVITTVKTTLARHSKFAVDLLDFAKYLKSITIYLPKKILDNLIGLSNYLFMIENPNRIILSAILYNDEKMSDTFATIYGYGPEIVSVLPKVTLRNDFRDEVIEDIPILSPLFGVYQFLIQFPIHLVCPHPELITRLKTQLNYLQKELNSEDLDPKMRKEIALQIESIEDIINNMLTRNKLELRTIDYKYQQMLNKYTDGDIREKMFWNKIDNHKEIKNTYDNIKLL